MTKRKTSKSTGLQPAVQKVHKGPLQPKGTKPGKRPADGYDVLGKLATIRKQARS